MSVLLITGDHPRHRFLATTLNKTGHVKGWIRETREQFLPPCPTDIRADLRSLFTHHFAQRKRIEEECFADNLEGKIEHIEVAASELNTARVKDFIQRMRPRLVISYGCHKLDVEYLNEVGATFWNTHGGLSPEYRGVVTHFWPSYFLEPQMTGMTLHETTSDLDGGAIVFQTAVSLVKGDGLHRLAARAVSEYAEALASHLSRMDFAHLPRGRRQGTSGRIFTRADWRPEHLVLVYRHHEDRIVDKVLSGELVGRTAKLVSVF